MDSIQQNRALDHGLFNIFLQKAVKETMSKDQFRMNVQNKFATVRGEQNHKELSMRGFLDWFKQWI